MISYTPVLTPSLVLIGILSAASILRLFQFAARRGAVGLGTSATLAIFLATAAPSIVSKVVGQQVSFYSALEEPVTLNGPAYQIATEAGLIALVVVLFVALLRAAGGPRDILSAPVGPAIALVTIFCAISAGTFLYSQHWPSPVITASVLLLLAVLFSQPDRRTLTFGVVLISQGVVLASALSGVLGLAGAVQQCRPDKCGVAGVLVSGVASHENSLGLLLVMTLPFLLTISDRRLMATSSAAVVLLIVISGSRSSLFALGGLALVWALVALLGDRPQWVRPWLLACVALVGILVSIVVTSSDLERGTFTGRAALWGIAREYIAAHPWIGIGANGWSEIRQTTGAFDSAALYSPHNQLLDVWLQGGVIAGVGFAALLLYWIRRGLRGDSTSLFYVTTLVWAGILERPVAFGSPDWSTLALASGILLLGTVSPSRPWRDSTEPNQTLRLDLDRTGI